MYGETTSASNIDSCGVITLSLWKASAPINAEETLEHISSCF